MKMRYATNQKGFTLVELMVAVSVFIVVMTISVGTLLVLIQGSSVAISSQTVTSNLSFAVDRLSRNIRTGYSFYCATATGIADTLPDDGQTNDCANGLTGFAFTDGETGERVGYRFNSTDNSIERKIETGDWLRLTSEDVVINDFAFLVEGSAYGDSTQPWVSIMVEAETGAAIAAKSTFFIQTSVTGFSLDE